MKNEAGDTNEVLEEAAEDTEEEGVNSEQKIISEKFSCNLNWRFIVKPESKSPIRRQYDQSEGLMTTQRACKNGFNLVSAWVP